MFLTNVVNEQTENNKQTNCFLKILIRKPIRLPLKAIHTDWIVDSYPQVKSAEHVAKINTKVVWLRSGTFPNFSWKLYQNI